jgi:hypothetical protein
MRLDTARKFALSLPEANEEPHFAAGSWRVKGKIFATIPPGGRVLRIPAGADETQALVSEDPAAFAAVVWGERVVPDWVEVNLAKASAKQVRELLEDAWRARAPKRVVAAYDARAHSNVGQPSSR